MTYFFNIVDFASDWQKRGHEFSVKDFYGEKGQFTIYDSWDCEVRRYREPNDTRKYEEDGYLPQQDVENLGTNYMGQLIILE